MHMYLRFVIAVKDENSGTRMGLFQASRELREAGLVDKYEEDQLIELRDWFDANLEKPASFTTSKIRSYLLNLEHPDGGPKAIWFHTLGYTLDEWQRLADDVMAIARDCDEFDTETTRFGVKYKATGWVGRPHH